MACTPDVMAAVQRSDSRCRPGSWRACAQNTPSLRQFLSRGVQIQRQRRSAANPRRASANGEQRPRAAQPSPSRHGRHADDDARVRRSGFPAGFAECRGLAAHRLQRNVPGGLRHLDRDRRRTGNRIEQRIGGGSSPSKLGTPASSFGKVLPATVALAAPAVKVAVTCIFGFSDLSVSPTKILTLLLCGLQIRARSVSSESSP